jgi:integrase
VIEQKQDRRKGRDRSNDKGRARLFNELAVSKLRLAKGEAEATYRDKKQPGLILRLNKSGAKVWRVQYYDASQRKMRSEGLGEFKSGSPAHVSVKDARKAAMDFKGNLDGILTERAAKALANRDSFKAVSDWYFEKFVEGQRRSAPQIKAIINAILPEWENKPFEAISRGEVASLLSGIAKTRGPRAADVTLAVLRRMMAKHAVRSNSYSSVIVEGMAQIEDPRERARDRILTDQEIRFMFKACDQVGTFGALCKMLLFTAQRRTKVAEMRFDDIDDAGVWTIPKEKREKGTGQRLRLPKPALDIVEGQRELAISEFVFPSSAGTAFSAFGQAKHELDVARGALEGIKVPALDTREYEEFKATPFYKKWNWTLHDIRRTSRSLMSRAGVRPDLAERVLGHAIAGVEGVYDRHSYDAEREAAVLSLANLIGEILHPPTKGGNVVSIKRR